MTPRPWNTGELKVLREFAGMGLTAVASLLERTRGSVEAKAKELHISLEVTNPDIDVTTATARLLERIVASTELTICPLCGHRLATMRQTGVCRPCHLDQLIEIRESQLADEIRLRKLTKLRQDKRRLRICEACGTDFYPRPKSEATHCSDCGGE